MAARAWDASHTPDTFYFPPHQAYRGSTTVSLRVESRSGPKSSSSFHPPKQYNKINECFTLGTCAVRVTGEVVPPFCFRKPYAKIYSRLLFVFDSYI